MAINFVLDFSSQTFLALELIDLHTSSHFELRFRFFVLSLAGYHFLEMEICHIFSAHIITAFLNERFPGMCAMNSCEFPCNLKLKDQVPTQW